VFQESRQSGAVPWSHWGPMTDSFTVLGIGVAAYIATLSSQQASVAGQFWWMNYRGSILILPVWLYGLAVGEGVTCRILSHPIISSYLAPGSYA